MLSCAPSPSHGRSLGQTVLVQNKPGAGGGVAAMAVKAAEPDGYTLIGTGSLTYAFEPLVLEDRSMTSRDFAHIAIVSLFQDGLFTHPSRPYKSMRDVIDAAKAEKRDDQVRLAVPARQADLRVRRARKRASRSFRCRREAATAR